MTLAHCQRQNRRATAAAPPAPIALPARSASSARRVFGGSEYGALAGYAPAPRIGLLPAFDLVHPHDPDLAALLMGHPHLVARYHQAMQALLSAEPGGRDYLDATQQDRRRVYDARRDQTDAGIDESAVAALIAGQPDRVAAAIYAAASADDHLDRIIEHDTRGPALRDGAERTFDD